MNMFLQNKQALLDQQNQDEDSVIFPFLFNPCPCLKRKQQEIVNYDSSKIPQPFKTLGQKLITLAFINPYRLQRILFDLYHKCPSYRFYCIMFYLMCLCGILVFAITASIMFLLGIDKDKLIQLSASLAFFTQLIFSILWAWSKSRLTNQFINVLQDWSYETEGVKIKVIALKSKGFSKKQFFKQDGNANCCFKTIKSIQVKRIA